MVMRAVTGYPAMMVSLLPFAHPTESSKFLLLKYYVTSKEQSVVIVVVHFVMILQMVEVHDYISVIFCYLLASLV